MNAELIDRYLDKVDEAMGEEPIEPTTDTDDDELDDDEIWF